jgi:hypothetical protein
MNKVLNVKNIATTISAIAIANPQIAAGGVVVSAVLGMVYKYAPSLIGAATTVGGFAYANTKLADVAIEQNNPGAYDYFATVSEFLAKIPGGFFSKVDSSRALDSGIKNANPEMIDAALGHGADVNRETADGFRVLEKALDVNSGAGNVIAQKLIQKGADLSKSVKEANDGNLFHKVIESGKAELVTDALKQAAGKPSLVESTNKDGNNLAHLNAISSDLRGAVKSAKVTLTSQSIDASNKAGKTGVDVAMFGYKSGKADSDVVVDYVTKASVDKVQKHFGTIVHDQNLVEQANVIVSKDGFNANLPDQSSSLALDYVLDSVHDQLALNVAKKTNPELLQNKHLWEASKNLGLSSETAKFLRGKILHNEVAIQSFFDNPASDGESLASKMILTPELFDRDVFVQIYNHYKAVLGNYKDPLNEQTALKLNWLHSAAISGNRAAVEAMQQIIIEEGSIMQKHFSALTGENGKCLASLYHHGFADNLKALTGTDKVLKSVIHGMSAQYVDNLKAIEEGPKEGEKQLAVVYKVKDECIKQEEEYLEKIAQLQEEEQRKTLVRKESLKEAQEEQEAQGMPGEIKLTAMKKYAPQINQNYAVGGGLIKQIVMSKGLVSALTGSDVAEGNVPLWTIAFGVGGYLEAFGKGHSKPDVEAAIGAGVYGFTEWVTQKNLSAMPKHTPVEERGIFDFTYKYGSDILSSSVANLVMQGASAYTGGYAGGAVGIAKSVLTAAGISTAKSYNHYTTDINGTTEKSEFLVTVENVAASVVAGYITSGAIISASAALATATTPLLMGAATLQTLAAMSGGYSAFGMAKLAIATALPIIEHVANLAYDAVTTLKSYITSDYSLSNDESIMTANCICTNNDYYDIIFQPICTLNDYAVAAA